MKKIGLIGLGRMGKALAQRWLAHGKAVVGYDPFTTSDVVSDYFLQVKTLEQLTDLVDVIWLMIPAGEPVKKTLQELAHLCKPETVIIDGGNSYYKDSITAARELKDHTIQFLDCGVSGGLYGEQNGFCCMVGGNKPTFLEHEDIFKALAATNGYAHVGPTGAGHYVKMVHNGIEYALLQAYAEGFHLLKDGAYKKLDLCAIAQLWQHGAIINSFILTMLGDILAHDQDFASISGKVAESGMGRWTVQDADDYSIPVKLIKNALDVRQESQKTGGNYATKLVALLRNNFGGHPFEKIDREDG